MRRWRPPSGPTRAGAFRTARSDAGFHLSIVMPRRLIRPAYTTGRGRKVHSGQLQRPVCAAGPATAFPDPTAAGAAFAEPRARGSGTIKTVHGGGIVPEKRS